jgi:hypothetical protein
VRPLASASSARLSVTKGVHFSSGVLEFWSWGGEGRGAARQRPSLASRQEKSTKYHGPKLATETRESSQSVPSPSEQHRQRDSGHRELINALARPFRAGRRDLRRPLRPGGTCASPRLGPRRLQKTTRSSRHRSRALRLRRPARATGPSAERRRVGTRHSSHLAFPSSRAGLTHLHPR